jgi:hypothetical protein
MSKTKILKILNAKIDRLILNGQASSQEYKRLTRLHYIITHA